MSRARGIEKEINADDWASAGREINLLLSEVRVTDGAAAALHDALLHAWALCYRMEGLERKEDRRRAMLAVTRDSVLREVDDLEKAACDKRRLGSHNENAVMAWLLRTALEKWGGKLPEAEE